MQVSLIKNNSVDTNNYLEKSPKDILTIIFDFAVFKDFHTLCALSKTCKKFRCVLTDTIDKIDPTANDSKLFLEACKYGMHFFVKRWIEKNKNLNFSIQDNLPIRTVCSAEMKNKGVSESDYYKLLDLFLEHSKIDSTIDPTVRGNSCIRFACANGKAQIVKRLLIDGRSNPFDESSLHLEDKELSLSHAFRIACLRGHHEVVDVLLENTEIIIPSDEEEHYKKHPDLYIELEELPRKAPFERKKEDHNWDLEAAASKGHVKVVSSLLRSAKLDFSKMNGFPIYMASQHGHLKVVELLLKDGRVDPSADSNLALRYAFHTKNYKMAELLRTDKRVLLGHLDPLMWIREI